MVDLNVMLMKALYIQTTEVGCYYGENELELNDLVITNKNLMISLAGCFLNQKFLLKKPLISIKVVNGVVQSQQANDSDYGNTLQTLYKNSRRELIEL